MNDRINVMLEAIRANEAASKRLDQLFELKLNGFDDKYTVDQLIESVFDKFCR